MKKLLFSLVFSVLGFIALNANPVTNYKMNLPIDTTYVTSVYSLSENGDSIMIKNNKFFPLNRYLNLENDQKEFFFEIHDDFRKSIDNLAIKGEDGLEEFKRHLDYELKMSKMILEDDQYRKYLRIINVTLNNKDLMKYLLKDKVC